MYDITEANIQRALEAASKKMSEFHVLAKQDKRILEELQFYESDISSKDAQKDIRSAFYSVASTLNAQAYSAFLATLRHEESDKDNTMTGVQGSDDNLLTLHSQKHFEEYSDPEADRLGREANSQLSSLLGGNLVAPQSAPDSDILSDVARGLGGRPTPADAIFDEVMIANSDLDEDF